MFFVRPPPYLELILMMLNERRAKRPAATEPISPAVLVVAGNPQPGSIAYARLHIRTPEVSDPASDKHCESLSIRCGARTQAIRVPAAVSSIVKFGCSNIASERERIDMPLMPYVAEALQQSPPYRYDPSQESRLNE